LATFRAISAAFSLPVTNWQQISVLELRGLRCASPVHPVLLRAPCPKPGSKGHWPL